MIAPKKQLGQNFLQDEEILKKIIEAAELTENDTVVEVGPGKGALTAALLAKAGRVIAVELDERLIAPLKIHFGHRKHFELHHENALQFIPPAGPYKLVANLPYYISSPLLNHFLLEQFLYGNPPTMMVIMLQKEVAERLVPNKGNHSLLSLEVQSFGTAEKICDVPPKCFYPRPKVDSAVVRIHVAASPFIHGNLKKAFWLFKVSFSQKRKKLTNNLICALRKPLAEIRPYLEKAKIPPDIRAEALSVDDWNRLLIELDSILPSFE